MRIVAEDMTKETKLYIRNEVGSALFSIAIKENKAGKFTI
jgi:hypothetical protein